MRIFLSDRAYNVIASPHGQGPTVKPATSCVLMAGERLAVLLPMIQWLKIFQMLIILTIALARASGMIGPINTVRLHTSA